MITPLAPITLFVYNRPWHTQRTVEALQKNELANDSDLFIYSDAPKNEHIFEEVTQVRKYINTIRGFKKITIVEQDKNIGLANSIINGVTEIVHSHGSVIVLEDDLVTSPYFLRFMNEGLEFYEGNNEIMSISGYNLPPSLMKFPENFKDDVFLNYRNSSWGWASWDDRWNLVDWDIRDYPLFKQDTELQKLFKRGGDDLNDMLNSQMTGKINSWSIRFSYAHFKQRMYSLCPRHSYVNNIGFDGTGTYSGKTNLFQNDLTNAKRTCDLIKNIQMNEEVMQEFRKFFRKKFFPVNAINALIKRLTE